MSSQPFEEVGNAPVHETQYSSADKQGGGSTRSDEPSQDTTLHPATVVVRGEVVADKEAAPAQKRSPAENKKRSQVAEVSDAKVKLQNRLPALDDDVDVGVEKEQRVIRDNKADLAFTGTLLASAAPFSAIEGRWQEYRVYRTNGGKHVLSKVARSVSAKEQDHYEAEVFDPSPSSVPSQLLRGARELTRSRPLMWTDAAVAFFGYDPLAKVLYRRLGAQFDEHIT